jgi:hypothetical protein
VCPLVDLLRPGFDRLLAGDQGNAVGYQHADHFGNRHLAQIIGHHEVHEVIDVGQSPAVERVDRHRAVQAALPDVGPRRGHVGGVGVEAVDEEAVAGS